MDMNNTQEMIEQLGTRLARIEELVELVLESHTIPQLIAGLRDEEPCQRQEATHYLHHVGELALPAIMDMICDDEEPKHARIAAVKLLGSMGEVAEEAIPMLLDLLRTMDDDEDFLIAITSALSRIDATVVLTLVQAWLETPDDVFIKSLRSVQGAVIPTLIDALSDRDGQICMAAAYMLYRLDDTRVGMVLRVLMGGLNDEDPDVRYHAVQILQLMPPAALRRTIPALIVALGDQDESVAETAAYILVHLGEALDKVVPVLVRALVRQAELSSQSRQLLLFPISQRPAEALAQVGGRAARSLAELLVHTNGEVRFQAAWALGTMREDAESALPELVEALSDEMPGVYENASQALISIGETAIPTLLRALQDPTAICQRVIHWATAAIGSPAVASQVLHGLAVELERSDRLSHWELLGLTCCNDKDSARTTFVQWLMEEDNSLPEYNVDEDIEPHEYREYPWRFLKVIEQGFSEACIRVLHVLREMGREATAAVPSLCELYEHSSLPSEVTEAIPYLLVDIGQPTEMIVNRLVEWTLDEGGDFHAAPALALAQMGDLARDVIPLLLIALDSPDREEWEVASEALVSIGEASIPPLIQALDGFMGDETYYKVQEIMLQVGNAQTYLAAAIRDQDNTPLVRHYAARLLGQIQVELGTDEDSVSALLEALADRQVQGAAASALAQLAEMDKRIIPALIEALGDGEPSLRVDVAYAVAEIGEAASEAIPLLAQLANDKAPEIRQAAEYALRTMGTSAPLCPAGDSP